MPIIPPKQAEQERELVPEGNHIARLYRLINIGTITTPYKDERTGELKKQSKIRLYFELPNEMREYTYNKGTDDEEVKNLPMSVSKEVTLSMYKSEKQTAALRKIAHALIGTALTDEEAESFDVEGLLGLACMLEIEHETHKESGNKYASVVGFGSIPKGMDVPEAINDKQVQNVREMTIEEIEELPDWLKAKMKSSDEYHVRFLAPRGDADGKMDYPEPDPSNDPDAVPF